MDVELCTYIKTERVYAFQPVFRCRTCQLVGNLGMCSVCAVKCHQGHDTFYHYYGSFFCDCGEKGSTFCNALVNSAPSGTDPDCSIVLKDANTSKIFECPICLNYMSGHIYICSRGHSVCGECKSKITTCPICRGAFAGAGTRNLDLESLGQSLEIPCEDCNENVRLSALNNHKKVCVMVRNKCPLDSKCEWVGMMWDIYDHCLNKHRERVFNGPTHEFQYTSFVPKEDGDVDIIEVNESLFMFHRKFVPKKDLFQGVVKYLTPQDRDCVLRYSLEFTSPRTGESILLQKNIRPASEELDDIYKLHQGVTLYMSQAIDIVQVDTLNYTLSINAP